MNREQRIKMLVVKGMMHRIEIAQDIQKIKDFKHNKGFVITKIFQLASAITNKKTLMILTPLLKEAISKSKVKNYFQSAVVIVGLGAAINIFKNLKSK